MAKMRIWNEDEKRYEKDFVGVMASGVPFKVTDGEIDLQYNWRSEDNINFLADNEVQLYVHDLVELNEKLYIIIENEGANPFKLYDLTSGEIKNIEESQKLTYVGRARIDVDVYDTYKNAQKIKRYKLEMKHK